MTNTDSILRRACAMAEENIVDREYARASELPDIETSKDFDKRIRKLASKARKSIKENKSAGRTGAKVNETNGNLHLVERKTAESEENVKEMTVRSAKRGIRVFVLVAALIALFSVTATVILSRRRYAISSLKHSVRVRSYNLMITIR